ncbi:hypothetical protein KY290_019887 [Solanum tuberosum]|uniref:Uncharacterized protein n=1 Tax=Solanum tuberosum TaxID=4113 RepID=A0ABQ7VIB4_SOLTU|nr:hypothetical protein KY284_017463 [Solanum tuberosum]KAH0690261.1 hypothetical protein KY289_017619 [Solanum tuberosum]KAH0763814.1 hypothetical protein KY290_019887 [Solanum tuberosum]
MSYRKRSSSFFVKQDLPFTLFIESSGPFIIWIHVKQHLHYIAGITRILAKIFTAKGKARKDDYLSPRTR